MDDPLDAILRRVAAGELSPEDAEPLITALAGPARADEAHRASEPTSPSTRVTGGGRAVRVQVTEGGRAVVNLRIPMSWTGLTSLVPGLSGEQVRRVTEALRNGEHGRILEIQDLDGDGVVISTE